MLKATNIKKVKLVFLSIINHIKKLEFERINQNSFNEKRNILLFENKFSVNG